MFKKVPTWVWFFVFFLVIFTANAFMIFWAKDSFTGLVTDQAYEKGLAYNGTITEREAQRELGWSASLETVSLSEDNLKQRILLTIIDKDGKPVTGAKVMLTLFRPTKAGVDVEIALKERKNTGVYTIAMGIPYKGQWDYRFVAYKGNNIFKVSKVNVIY